MTESEIVQLKTAGFTDKQIKNFRKVVRSKNFQTSNDVKYPDFFTLDLPQEAVYFFGIRRRPSAKIFKPITLILNSEKFIENVNSSLFNIRKAEASLNDEYIETSRILIGKDSLIYSCNYGATITESVSWFYAVDITLMPKEGTVK